MPVHSREKKESNHEEMEVDFPEQDGSSTDEDDTVSSTVSEDGDSSGKENGPKTRAWTPLFKQDCSTNVLFKLRLKKPHVY